MLSFTKMHGLGNDFVIIDATTQPFSVSSEQIRLMAHRRYGVGFDQLLVIEPPREAQVDFNYRIFNADGGEAAQCGNGARCVGRYIHERGLSSKHELILKTLNSYLKVTIGANQHILVDMGKPTFEPQLVPFRAEKKASSYTIALPNQQINCAVMALGNPHAVLFVNELDNLAMDYIGGELNRHAQFPEGVNVGFAKILSPTHVQLRVYERGVGETLACGSGACAAAVVGKQAGLLAKTDAVVISQPGGDLTIHWQGVDTSVRMEGPAEFVYSGTWLGAQKIEDGK